MKTILVATDFSETAANAARYAAAFADTIGAKKIILYNAYAIAVSTDIALTMLEQQELQAASSAGLEHTAALLKPLCHSEIIIETMADPGFFGQRLQEAATEVLADLTVIGTTGGGGLEKAIFGSNTITALHGSTLPLLIIPPNTLWKPIKKIAWACDYQHVEETAPLQKIDSVLKLTKAKLYVVHNTENDEENLNPEVVRSSKFMDEFFQDQAFEVKLIGGKSLSDSINQYVSENAIDWLVVAPHKHTWLANLFTKDHTKDLVFHTHVPILCLQ